MNVSKVTNTTNPFDSGMLENLSTTTAFSPDMFSAKSKDTSSQSSFRWSIEQMARLHPVDIDESQSDIVESPDSALEARLNSAIEKFWSSQKFVVPSPDTNMVKSPCGLGDSGNRYKQASHSEHRFGEGRGTNRDKKYEESPLVRGGARPAGLRKHKEIQTLLTFPPSLDLVKLLGGRFQYDEEEGGAEEAAFEANLSINTLRRKLFTEESEPSFTGRDLNIDFESGSSQRAASKSRLRSSSPSSCDISLRSFSDSASVGESLDSDYSREGENDHLSNRKGQRRMPSPDVSPIKADF
ncbi:unnamed protein product [Enterobius vermicularis]|uniref:Protein aurora borealis n=1 Tax=Enterobius vermicularis TaxID=51028 RepID=A0A0N4VJT5_ENTVE|nr:unnamed protein product [Enterobius vermicularis]